MQQAHRDSARWSGDVELQQYFIVDDLEPIRHDGLLADGILNHAMGIWNPTGRGLEDLEDEMDRLSLNLRRLFYEE
ncbi:uncharacterized protein BDZ99DRAFT_514122 [Mytilinidion resinicola]|uniref:Uncharacterized protein n=1 Tax=Mytilinidion resinicola TaxID=574789 RepID=A0A6A6Z9V3_9PEZI|nr:uncharacterized protein BDZ99DRAFT_514122 [Mytilinidion resinicola]KAF2817901.1 hypothetical protein BDZ99DRAFT_514122 [Mytilinidion resinicola]